MLNNYIFRARINKKSASLDCRRLQFLESSMVIWHTSIQQFLSNNGQHLEVNRCTKTFRIRTLTPSKILRHFQGAEGRERGQESQSPYHLPRSYTYRRGDRGGHSVVPPLSSYRLEMAVKIVIRQHQRGDVAPYVSFEWATVSHHPDSLEHWLFQKWYQHL